MMRSLFSGVSGLKVHQTKMDVIGNNIANVNTTGYKSSRATFAEVFSQTLSGASAPNADTNRAGVNPRQIGLGSTVASIDKNMTEGAANRTDIATDLKIEGDAFFIVGDASGKYFTRDGSFTLDIDGTLATTSGMNVYGWNTNADGEIIKGQVEPIKILSPENLYNEPVPTTSVEFNGNLYTADGLKNPPIERDIYFYDTLGNKYMMPLEFTYTNTGNTEGSNTWQVGVKKNLNPADPTDTTEKCYMYMNGDMKNPIEIKGSSSVSGGTGGGGGGGSDLTNLATITFDSKTGKLTVDSATEFKFQLDPLTTPVNSEFAEITVDLSGLTQFNETTSAKAQNNGAEPGKLQDYSIGEDGVITGTYSNGTSKTFGQISVATFSNPAGLQKKGNNLYITTPNSGEFDGIGQDPTAGGNKLNAGTLEMSNVDLASEFTDMITTQRGFQANSKVITTSDEMLQELVNLKR